MPATSASEHEGTAEQVSTNHRLKPLWKKPIVWLGTLLVAAVGGALTGWLQPKMSDALNEAAERGEPVLVGVEQTTLTRDKSFWPPDMWLPSGVSLSAADMSLLGSMEVEQQLRWLQDQGGVPLAGQTVRLTLNGNRANQVRITDMVANTDCEQFPQGSLVSTAIGRGAMPESAVLSFFIDENPEGPWVFDSNSQAVFPYFPQKTITLQKNEEEYVVVNLIPGSPPLNCQVYLEMIVNDNGEQKRQRIPDDGTTFTIMHNPFPEQETPYKNVYLGGEICKNYVQVPPIGPGESYEYQTVCGPGNSNFRKIEEVFLPE